MMKKTAWTIVFLIVVNISLFVIYGSMLSSKEEPVILPEEEVIEREEEEVNSAPSFSS